MKRAGLLYLFCVLAAYTIAAAVPVWATPLDKIDSRERCVVCGMFVAKYPNWITQLRDQEGKVRCFDGVKDLMAFYFAPTSYGADSTFSAREIWVKDYYSLGWVDGRQAFYVVGSDVYGPMGEEFIAFADRQGADNFLKDHHGSRVLGFAEITSEMVDALRSMHKMKGQMAK